MGDLTSAIKDMLVGGGAVAFGTSGAKGMGRENGDSEGESAATTAEVVELVVIIVKMVVKKREERHDVGGGSVVMVMKLCALDGHREQTSKCQNRGLTVWF